MAITFPGSPSVGQLVTQNSRTYQWTGKTWDLYGNVGVHKSTHATGGSDALTPSDIGAAPVDSPVFTGNVGIGGVTPTCRMDIQATSTIANQTWTGGTDFVRLLAGSGSAFSEQSIAFQESGGDVGARIGVKNRGLAAYDIIFANRDNSSITSTFAERMRVAATGNVGIGISVPTISSGTGLHCAGSTLRLGTSRTPSSSTATGNTGEICWDASYLYVCVNTNTWRRIAHSTW